MVRIDETILVEECFKSLETLLSTRRVGIVRRSKFSLERFG